MLNLENQKINLQCSSCLRKHSVTLKDITNKKNVHCSCGADIQLTDSSGSVRNGLKDVKTAMKEFERTIKKLGR
jgi:transcription initiation factor IIE alpha subunit